MMREESSKIEKSQSKNTKTSEKFINFEVENDDVLIQEVSDNDNNSSTGNLIDNQLEIPEIEFESEENLENEKIVATKQEGHFKILSIETFPYCTNDIPDLEESILHEINCSKNDFKTRRFKKRAALESYFSPCFFTPRYLDSIKEEGSDLNDVDVDVDVEETKNNLEEETKTSKSSNNDIEDNHSSTVENQKFIKKLDVVFPKSSLDFSQRKRHVSNLPRTVNKCIIQEEIPCYIVETKILEQIIPVEENCSTCINETIANPDAAEIIYLESTSSSSSDIMDLDNIGADDADIEDLNDDTDMKITTLNIDINDDEIYFFRKSETPTKITNESVNSEYHNNNDIKSVCSNDSAYGNENRSYANCEKNESKNIFDYDNIHPRNTQKEISRDADDFIIHDNYQTPSTFQTKNNNQRQNFCDQFCANTIKKIKNENNNNFDIASSLENNLKLADEVNQNQQESYERNQQFSDTKNNEKFSENISEVNTIDLDSQYEKRLLEIKKVASECIQEIIHKCEQQLNSKLEIEENLSGKINILKINNNTNNLVTEICDNMNDNDTSIKSLLDEKSEIHNKKTDESCENINVENIIQHHLSTNGEIVKKNLNVDDKEKCENFDSSTSSEIIDSSISNVNKISENENSVQNVSNDKENVSNTEQNNININVVEYNRQDSSGSDNSHSTDHSLCTAINKGSFSHIECDIGKDSLESSQYLEQKSPEIMSSETTSIKTLRQLCVGKLITMPYGNVVLEELASFSKSLSDLTNKYEREKKLENSQVDPLLKLPQINNLGTSASKNETDTKIQLSSPLHSDNLESSPPPVPELPVDDIWLMVSAQKNLKMPLSLPSLERNYLKKTKSVDEHTADHSFDMQKKFDERGEYNELIAKKFNKNILPSTFHSHNDDIIQSSSSSLYIQQPPTIPPPLPRSSRSYNTERQIAIDAENNDKNNHRLLAIIRDSKQPLLSENESRGKVEQVEKLPSEFKTNNHHYWCDQQLQKSEKIERNIEKKEISESTKLTETAIIKEEKMPFKIDGEEYNRFPDEDIFNNNCKKFYNMESTPYFCNQLRQTLPKRYSNIETSSYKSEKRMENGNVVYEYSDSSKEKVTDEGKESDQRNQKNQNNNNSTNTDKSTNSNSFEKKGEEFSDFKPRTFTGEFSYEEFRRRAKESAKKAKDEFLKRENFFKSYDDITKYFEDYNDEKQSNKIFREKTEESKIYSIPIKIDSELSSKKQNSDNNNKMHDAKIEKNHSEYNNKNTFVIPVVVESKKSNQPNKSPAASAASAATTSSDENVFHIPVILEENNSKMKTDKNKKFFRTNSLCHDYNKNDKLQEKHRSHQNLNECMCCTVEFDASPKNITKPFRKEVEIIHKARQSNAKAPRLSVSTSNLSMEPKTHDFYRPFSRIDHYNSSFSQPSIDQTPISCFINPRFSKRASLPDEIHNQELDRIKMKEMELRAEFEKLENERCRLVKEMDLMAKPSFLKDYQNNIRPEFSSYRSRNLSNSFEEDTFRQMYNEWLNKVAEREERRLHKIIKISKPSSDITQMYDHNKERKSSDISDEFLKRVKERRSKLHMPSDSDWESGAESQPISTENNENDKISHNENVKVIEGQTEADLNHLPKHLREFVEFTSQKVIDNENVEHHTVKEKQHKNEISSLTIKNDSTTTSTSKSSKITETKSTIKNSINRNDGRYPYKSNGYMSEPETHYDSDYSTMKYHTIEKQSQHTPLSGRNYGSMPSPIKSAPSSYKNQPGRIEDYVPGNSSVSEMKRKNQIQQEQFSDNNNYSEGYLSRVLKQQGYESDSNLVFRKKKDSPAVLLSPVEQKQAYKSVQAGGEPPLHGFRKPAPEKSKESDAVILPLSTVKGSLDENDQNSETFRRYFESDVNIHYKTPIRYEYKESVPEEELVRKQAETMKKLYEEERHRKYLQELQDASKRRHTDNFTPSQKSPVPLNRYDDFVTNVAPKQSNSSIYPKIVARALYNFQGQTAKELTFKKGDIIYIRRQVDKNWYEGEHNAMIGLLPANYIEIITKDGTKQPPKKLLEGQARAKFNFQAQSAIELSLNKGELVTLTRRVDENWFEGKIANRKGIFPVSYVEVLTDIGSEDNTQQQQHQTHNKPIGIPVSHSLITCPNRTTAITAATSPPSLDTLRTNIYDEFDNLTNNHPKNTILRETKSIRNTEVLHIDTNTEPIAYRALYKYRPQNNDELELQENDIVYVLEKCDDGWYVGTSQRTGCFGTFPGNYVERVFKDTLLK